MLFVGIDVAKSKHDCYIIDSNGVIITDSRGKYGREKAIQLRELAANSIGSSRLSNYPFLAYIR